MKHENNFLIKLLHTVHYTINEKTRGVSAPNLSTLISLDPALNINSRLTIFSNHSRVHFCNKINQNLTGSVSSLLAMKYKVQIIQ